MENLTAVKTNQQIVQEAYTEFMNGNIGGIIDRCADDIVWKTYDHPELPATGTFVGKAGVMDFFKALESNVEFLDFQPKEFIAQGENVVVLGSQSAQARSTGKTFANDWCMHFRLRGGLIYSYYAYLDTLSQFKAFSS